MDKGASASQTGPSQVEPVPVSPLRASVPSAYQDMTHGELAGLRKDYAKMLHAAQAARKLAERHIQQIRLAMENPKEAPSYDASDHAVVRYLERVWKMDISAIREEMALECAAGIPVCGEQMRANGEAIFCLNAEGFITTVLPADDLLKEEHREAVRSARLRPNARRRRRVKALIAARDDLVAQAIEARRAETLGSACESAVTEGDAPNSTPEPSQVQP